MTFFFYLEFPKKPKGKLEQLVVRKVKKQPPNVNELQTLIESHFVTNPHYFYTVIKVVDVSPFYLSNLDSLKSYLQTGDHVLKKSKMPLHWVINKILATSKL